MRLTLLFLLTLATTGCHRMIDRPQLAPGTRVEDITVPSAALARNATYRVITPTHTTPSTRLPVVVLLHGAGDNFRSWSNNSAISALAAHGIVLVMPDAGNSFYIDSAARRHSRYETFLATELLPSVYAHIPQAATDRDHTAVVGISRGGFGAMLLALKHPQLFGFVGGMSSAFDLPTRPFRIRELRNSIGLRRHFGPRSDRARNDPFALLAATPPERVPFIALTCGEHDVLLITNRRMDAALTARNIPHTFTTAPGDHDWRLWNMQLPALESALLAHFHIEPAS